MIGFCLAIPGLKQGKAYLHSHMLGVLPEYRDEGVGRKMKLSQRDEALARGIDLIEWTFDPLEIKNAYFNIERLGAIVRRYVPNQYGTTYQPSAGRLPTDRCIAEWWIGSPRVKAILAGKPLERSKVEAHFDPLGHRASFESRIPSGRAIQQKAGEQFLASFERGLAVIGFENRKNRELTC